MGRLTEWKNPGQACVKGRNDIGVCSGAKAAYFAIVDRLAAYEDTGLTPEQITEMQREIAAADLIESQQAEIDNLKSAQVTHYCANCEAMARKLEEHERRERENQKSCEYCGPYANKYLYVSDATDPRTFFDVTGATLDFLMNSLRAAIAICSKSTTARCAGDSLNQRRRGRFETHCMF